MSMDPMLHSHRDLAGHSSSGAAAHSQSSSSATPSFAPPTSTLSQPTSPAPSAATGSATGGSTSAAAAFSYPFPHPGASSSSHHDRGTNTTHSSPAPPHPLAGSYNDASLVDVSIKCPLLDHDLRHHPVQSTFKLPPSTTVGSLKQLIGQSWPGRPSADGMRLIRSGKLLADSDLVKPTEAENAGGDAFSQADTDAAAAQANAVSVHLVIRPDAWTEPLPKPARRPVLSPRASFARSRTSSARGTSLSRSHSPAGARSSSRGPTRPSPELQEASTSASSSAANLRSALLPSSPSSSSYLLTLVGWTYAVLHAEYAGIWHEAYGMEQFEGARQGPCSRQEAISEIASSNGLSVEDVEAGVQHVEGLLKRSTAPERDVAEDPSSALQATTGYVYQQVEIDGLPYLLRLSRTPSLLSLNDRLTQLHEHMTALQDMEARLNRLVTLNRLAASHARNAPRSPDVAAWSDDILRRLGMVGTAHAQGALGTATAAAQAAGGATAAAAAADAAPAQPAIRIPLTTVATALLTPLFMLSLKVSMLVYIFTRNAGPVKRYAVFTAAALYVGWEAWRIFSREVQREERRRGIRRGSGVNANAARRAVDGNAPPQARGVTREREDATQGGNAAEMTSAQTARQSRARPLAPMRYRAAQGSFEWFMERLAYVNLEAEDVELGFDLADVDGRPRVRRRHNQPQQQREGGITSKVVKAAWDKIGLPALLFLFTLVPDVETRRRRAVDERESLIRIEVVRQREREEAEKRDEENKGRRVGGEKDQAGPSASTTTTATSTSTAARSSALHPSPAVISSDYTQRLLRQRRAASPDGLERHPTSSAPSSEVAINLEEELRVVRRADRARERVAAAAARRRATLAIARGRARGDAEAVRRAREEVEGVLEPPREPEEEEAEQWEEEAGEMGFF